MEVETVRDTKDFVAFLLGTPFSTLSFEDKLFIKQQKKPTPDLPALISIRGNQKRSFNNSWYHKCAWITGSFTKNKLFCWPCLLFSTDDENAVWSRSGFEDLKNIARCINRHEKSKEHIRSKVELELLGRQNVIAVLDPERKTEIDSFNDKVRENRSILRRLLDITIFSNNRGNFKELVTLLSKNNENLKKFQISVFLGTSKSIRNDLVDSIAFTLREKIRNEILEAPFISWQIDETTDTSCHSQLSVVFRYVIGGEVVERFFGFFDISYSRTAESLYNFLTQEFEDFSLKDKLVAQAYDGAAVMAGELNWLQSKIKEIAPQATFTHCHAHCLNLVLGKSCGWIRDCRIFFSNLSGFSTFFSKSTKRTCVLDDICGSRVPSDAPTRWNFTSRAVFTVYENRTKLIEVFQHIIDSEDFHSDQPSTREAIGLKNYLLDEKFCFLLKTFNSIFEQTDVVFSILQNRSTDINFAKSRLEQLIRRLQEFRDNDSFFQNVFDYVDDVISESSAKKRKLNYDPPDTRQDFQQLFVEILETILGQIEIRFSDLDTLCYFDLVNKDYFKQFSKKFPEDLFQKLTKQYPYFDSLQLKNELILIYEDREVLGESNTPTEMLNYLHRLNLSESLPNLYKLLSIIVTIPVTSASAEPSFSALKRIKTYTRNKISQNRLCDTSLTSIEKELVKFLCRSDEFYNTTIDYFGEQKNRRIPLKYKSD